MICWCCKQKTIVLIVLTFRLNDNEMRRTKKINRFFRYSIRFHEKLFNIEMRRTKRNNVKEHQISFLEQCLRWKKLIWCCWISDNHLLFFFLLLFYSDYVGESESNDDYFEMSESKYRLTMFRIISVCVDVLLFLS